jgi:HupF/HypC family protein
MCLAIPGKIVELPAERPQFAAVEVAGVRRQVNIDLLSDETLLRYGARASRSSSRRRLRHIWKGELPMIPRCGAGGASSAKRGRKRSRRSTRSSRKNSSALIRLSGGDPRYHAVSALLKGDPALGEVLAAEERHHLPVVVIGEYRYGRSTM